MHYPKEFFFLRNIDNETRNEASTNGTLFADHVVTFDQIIKNLYVYYYLDFRFIFSNYVFTYISFYRKSPTGKHSQFLMQNSGLVKDICKASNAYVQAARILKTKKQFDFIHDSCKSFDEKIISSPVTTTESSFNFRFPYSHLIFRNLASFQRLPSKRLVDELVFEHFEGIMLF